jgi:hypothetical protein
MSLAGDRDRAGNRRRRITRRRHACHRVKKTWTVIRHARHRGLADALAANALVVAMVEPTLGRSSMPSARCSLGLGPCCYLARLATETLSAVAGPTDTEHELAQTTPLEAKLLVVHRLLPGRRKNLLRASASSIVCSKPTSIG